jgi:alpha-2-macroglobulin-like protein
MTVTVRDERGLPMPGHFSLSVTNDQLLSFADDKSGNILSKLLLEQDIKDKVEEPAFYFDGKDPKADLALDHLLMTSGWRRFTWEQVINKNLPQVKFSGEQALVAGAVYDAETGKPVAKAKVKLNNNTVFTNDKGQYSMRNIEPVFPVYLQISAEGYNEGSQFVYDYTQGLTLHLYKPGYYTKSNYYNKPIPSVAMGAMGGDDQMVKKARNPVYVADKNKGEAKKEQARVNRQGNIPQPAPKEMEVDAKKAEIIFDMPEMAVKDGRLARAHVALDSIIQPNQGATYFRARQFPAPVYDKQEKIEVRNDFRSTIYWNGSIDLDRTGKKVIEFYNSDDISSFRATAEGLSVDGMVGRAEMTYFTQLPFSISTKIPSELITGDLVSIPLTMKNNTDGPLGGIMNIIVPEGLQPIASIPSAQTIMPGKTKTIYLDYKVSNKATAGEFKISFKSCGLSDGFSQHMRIIPRGFPVTASFSGQELEKEFSVELSHVVDSSIRLSLSAYPSVVNDLMTGIEGILREPGGCFEQTSMSSYPNAMVLDYLKTTDNKDDKTLSQATALLDRGYKRLSTFETKDKGYEWFGSAPGHEALTAYGLMQFADMKRVGGDVDQGMMDRTSKWLMSRKDGSGGYLRNARALDNFGRGSEEITNAYITYALAEAGYKDIRKELDHSYSKAIASNDAYMLALMANAMYKNGDIKQGDKLTEMLYAMQADNGSWTGKNQSITYSTGQSLTIETTSLAIMAILKQAAPNYNALTKAVQFLVGTRSGYGTFGNTQGTVLALKALTEFAKASKKTASDGTIEFYVDGKKVVEKFYTAGTKGNIEIDGLEKYLRDGKHKLKVKFKGTKDPLPYAVAASWNTTLPVSSDKCPVRLTAKLPAKTINVGETMRLSVTLANTKNEILPSPIAIIGIPGGFTVQPWQLKEMQEKNVFDYYEVIGNNIIIYYRGMKPMEARNINFDLKAEVPGEYSSPASSSYLYYTNEYKSWTALDKVIIKKQLVQN